MTKIALITGANSGIGKATAHHFADRGYQLALTARRADLLEKVAQQISTPTLTIPTDITQAEDVDRLIAQTLTHYPHIDILIHAAGIAPAGTILDTDEATWDAILDTNLKGTYLINRAVLKHMVDRQSGSIVNIASDAGITGGRNLAAYCASKGGVVLLTKAMALDHARQGVRINALCPGPVETPMTAAMSPEEMALWKQMLPIQRFATAAEIAEAAFFLAHAKYATGSCLSIDGGNTAGGSI